MERWTWRTLLERPVLVPALAAVTGAATASPGPAWALGLASVGAWLLAAQPLRPAARWGVLVLGFLLAGACLARLHAVEAPLGSVAWSGEVEVESVSETREGRGRLEVHLLGPPHGRALLAARGWDVLPTPGARLRLVTKLRPVTSATNPGEPDWGHARTRRGVAWTGNVRERDVALVAEGGSWAREMADTQQRFARFVRSLAPGPDSAGLFLALAAGRRAELDDALEEDFARSGLAHVLSVSGLHVAGLSLALLAVARLLSAVLLHRVRWVDLRRWAAPACLPPAWLYVAWTGWQGPAVRSALMWTLAALALAAARLPDAPSLLAWSALLMLVVSPGTVADLSLQLSFLALLGLMLGAPALRDALPLLRPHEAKGSTFSALRRGLEPLLAAACGSLAAVLWTLPVLSWSFGRTSLVGILSNVVALPLSAALTVTAAGTAALFPVSPELAGFPGWLGCHMAAWLVWLARTAARLPGAALELPLLGAWGAACWYAGLSAWSLGRGRWRAMGVLAPAALFAAWVGMPTAWGPGLVVTFLDVGQGDATVVSSRGRHLLVDGGGVPHGADPGERVVVPFLRYERIGRLSLAVLTHPHPDHALGLASTLRHVPVDALWLGPEPVEGLLTRSVREAARGAQVVRVHRGSPPFQLGEAVVEVLGPPEDDALLESVNDRSVVLGITHGRVHVLLTGDMEADAEGVMPGWPADVLKAPHHGSRTSSTAPFLERVRPRVAVFCVGRENRFGFPAPEVQARYGALGATCYRTDLHGAVRVESDGKDIRVLPFKAAQRGLGGEALRAQGASDDS
jgi:competence protein ComEC